VTDAEQGLSEVDAATRLLQGRNELPQRSLRSPLQLLAGQFSDPMILVLLVAASIALLMGETGDSVMIIVIVALNGILGFVQEFRAEHALAALNRMAAPQAQVVRGGQIHKLPATDLVAGDLVVLEAGNQVPADARLVDSVELAVQESALTGESDAVEKDFNVLLPEATSVADRINMVFQGTLVTRGRALAMVVATGKRN
jgi:P-type Ca2+ transporter type 2C